MAAVWMDAIDRARQANILQPPEDNGTPDDAPSTICDKIPGQADGPHATQKGYGFDDGPYVHRSTKMGRTTPEWMPAFLHYDTTSFGFGQIVNRFGNLDPKGALDDFIMWGMFNVFVVTIFYHVNRGDLTFEDPVRITVEIGCDSSKIEWHDMNGDLMDDLVCIRPNGDLRVASMYSISTTLRNSIC
jgi:hypothetical protein